MNLLLCEGFLFCVEELSYVSPSLCFFFSEFFRFSCPSTLRSFFSWSHVLTETFWTSRDFRTEGIGLCPMGLWQSYLLPLTSRRSYPPLSRSELRIIVGQQLLQGPADKVLDGMIGSLHSWLDSYRTELSTFIRILIMSNAHHLATRDFCPPSMPISHRHHDLSPTPSFFCSTEEVQSRWLLRPVEMEITMEEVRGIRSLPGATYSSSSDPGFPIRLREAPSSF